MYSILLLKIDGFNYFLIHKNNLKINHLDISQGLLSKYVQKEKKKKEKESDFMQV